jgi:hypothetical protein
MLKIGKKSGGLRKFMGRIGATIQCNSSFLSLKSYYRLIFKRNEEIINYDYPLLVVSGLQRSGTTMVTQLLRNHPQILSYYAELHIGRPNKYHWPHLVDAKNSLERFKLLIPRNLAQKFLNVNSHENFMFDFARFKKIFLLLDENNNNGNQREILNHFFTAYFNAYLNCNHSNYYDKYKYIVASIPGLTLFESSIDNFVKDYPDGKIIVMVRDPLIWWNSARRHSDNLKIKGLKRYELSLNNTMELYDRHPDKIIVVSYDQLIKNSEESIKLILNSLQLESSEIAHMPSNFPYYGMDNSTYGHKKTNKIIKDKVNRKIDISKDEEQFIIKNIYPNYENVLNNLSVNKISE